jgi:hypothetical protein
MLPRRRERRNVLHLRRNDNKDYSYEHEGFSLNLDEIGRSSSTWQALPIKYIHTSWWRQGKRLKSYMYDALPGL